MRRPTLLAATLLTSGLLAGCALFEGGALSRKYVVFFSRDSTSLDHPARRVVQQAAEAAANHPELDLLVEGYAANNGDPADDGVLAVRRGEVVADALRADGVAANRIIMRPRPPSNETAGEAARRVEIDFTQ